jgi:hypothetical protein
MMNWYPFLEDKARVLVSESGYTNTELALEYLEHLILHIPATAKKPKVLLMDQHGSHMDDNFIIKATDHHIHPYPFPGHLTHILQPLDVGVFQPYKHWHRKAVQHATRNLDIEYTVSSFLRDLQEIRTSTFKKGTIQGAFRKSGIWPIDCEVALKKMKLYQPPEPIEEPELPPRTPKRYNQAEKGLYKWSNKLKPQLSSPSRQALESWERGTTTLLLGGELSQLQLQQLQVKVANQQKARIRSRGVVQKGGVLTGEEARARIAEKEVQRKALEENKRQFLMRTTRNKIKRELKVQGVTARRQEKERIRRVQDLQRRKEMIPAGLMEPIPDPEKLTTTEEIELLVQESLVILPEFSGVSFDYTEFSNIGIQSQEQEIEKKALGAIDPRLEFITQEDFIQFPDSEDEDEELDIQL